MVFTGGGEANRCTLSSVRFLWTAVPPFLWEALQASEEVATPESSQQRAFTGLWLVSAQWCIKTFFVVVGSVLGQVSSGTQRKPLGEDQLVTRLLYTKVKRGLSAV